MDETISLDELGLNKKIKDEFEEKYKGFFLGRVSVEYKNSYKVLTQNGEVMSRISGKLDYEASLKSDYPAVGDWVALDRENNSNGDAIIHGILTRKSVFSRKTAGKTSDEQIVATNVDTLFICMALNNDYNISRLERYISLAWESGANPVVILTKADLCDDVSMKVFEVEQVALGIDVLVVSAISKEGINDILAYIKPKETIAFIGSSGIGKSTLINTLLGDEKQKVNEIRKDEKGRHTTTYRELIKLPSGGIVIDTPGMREIQIFSADIDTSFNDIEEIAKSCHFTDCKHESEPKCAVKQAIKEGRITEQRLRSYKKLKKELEYFEDKKVLNAKQLEKKKIIQMTGSLDGMKKAKNR
ncbi:MAG: ribosome small subunit-dependent GTPase A [Clostridia bacterium]|nr:ribosome small subunit-dependent GTPase A [Clostridia bacterium]